MAKMGKIEDPRAAEILLEVTPRSVSGDLAPRTTVPEDFRRRASEIADSVAGVANEFRSRLGSVLQAPAKGEWGVDSIEIKFEVAVQAETGIVIAKASTAATFSVTLTVQKLR